MLTVVLPTKGDRDTLRLSLLALQDQFWEPEDRVLCVCDGLLTETAKQFWGEARLPGSLIELPGGPYGDWGHTPRNMINSQLLSGYVVALDDDDVLAPHAFDVITNRIKQHPGAFFFFRVDLPNGDTNWRNPEVKEVNVGNSMFVWPADCHHGQYGTRFGGDFDFIKSTINSNPDREVIFCEEAINICRPHEQQTRDNPTDAPHFEINPDWLTFFKDWFEETGHCGMTNPVQIDNCFDVTRLDTGSFDTIMALDALHYQSAPEAWLTHMLRAARKFVILATPNLWVYRMDTPCDRRQYSPPRLLHLASQMPEVETFHLLGCDMKPGSVPVWLSTQDALSSKLPMLLLVLRKP